MAPPPGGGKNPGKRIAAAVLTPDRGVSFFVPVLIKNINQQFLDIFFLPFCRALEIGGVLEEYLMGKL